MQESFVFCVQCDLLLMAGMFLDYNECLLLKENQFEKKIF